MCKNVTHFREFSLTQNEFFPSFVNLIQNFCDIEKGIKLGHSCKGWLMTASPLFKITIACGNFISVHQADVLHVCLSACLPVSLSACLPVRLSVRVCILSAWISVCVSVCVSSIFKLVCVSDSLPLCLRVYLSPTVCQRPSQPIRLQSYLCLIVTVFWPFVSLLIFPASAITVHNR